MIDVTNDKLLSFSEAATVFPGRAGKKGNQLCYETVREWATKGVRGVVLESIPLGGRRYTTAECVRAFCDALANMEPRKRSPRKKNLTTEHDEAMAALEAHGVR